MLKLVGGQYGHDVIHDGRAPSLEVPRVRLRLVQYRAVVRQDGQGQGLAGAQRDEEVAVHGDGPQHDAAQRRDGRVADRVLDALDEVGDLAVHERRQLLDLVAPQPAAQVRQLLAHGLEVEHGLAVVGRLEQVRKGPVVDVSLPRAQDHVHAPVEAKDVQEVLQRRAGKVASVVVQREGSERADDHQRRSGEAGMGILRGDVMHEPLPQALRGFALVMRGEYVELPSVRLVQVCEMVRGDGEDLVHQRLVVEGQPHELCLPDVAYLASPGEEEASHGAVVMHQLEVRDPR